MAVERSGELESPCKRALFDVAQCGTEEELELLFNDARVPQDQQGILYLIRADATLDQLRTLLNYSEEEARNAVNAALVTIAEGFHYPESLAEVTAPQVNMPSSVDVVPFKMDDGVSGFDWTTLRRE